MATFKGFSVSPGADPLGIGVPFYGESSFDPVEFVRRSWEETRAKRILRDKNAKESYDNFVKDLPKPEAWEAATSEAINKDITEFSQQVYNDYQSGEFDPTSKDPFGGKKTIEYNKRARELQGKVDIYKTLGDKYKANYSESIKPSNIELLDHELTKQRFDQFMSEPDLQKKSEMLTEPLVVFKPKPVEVIGELQKAFNTFIPGLDKKITSEDFDEETGKLRVTTTEGMDPARLEKGLEKAWGALSERVQNEFKRRYNDAPASEKRAKLEDGTFVDMDIKDWFKSRYSPEYARKMNVEYVSQSEGATNINWSKILPGKDNTTGRYNLDPFREVRVYGKKVSSEPGVKPIEKNYESFATIKLQNVFGSGIMMPNSITTIDAETGEKEPASKSAFNIPIDVQILPIATKTTVLDIPGKGTETIQAGEMIPDYARAYMDGLNAQAISQGEDPQFDYAYDAFLYSRTDYKQQAQSFNFGEISMPMGTSSESKTTIRRWADSKNDLISGAQNKNKKADLDPLVKTVDDILNQLNQSYDQIINNASKAASYEEAGF